MVTDGTPLYIQVRNKIKDAIMSGDIRPDASGVLPGQQHFAEIYNVGLMTVKRAIKDLEQMGLVESRRGKGLILKSVTPVRTSRAESAGGMIRIGVVFFDIFKSIGNPVVARLVSGIETFARANNIVLHMISFPGLETDLQERSVFSEVPITNLDGVLLLSPVTSSSIAELDAMQLPYVSLSLLSDEKAICHGMDVTSASFQITNAILELGARNIVFFCGSQNRISGHMMTSGHRMALAKYGLKVDPDYVAEEDYDIEAATSFLASILSSGRPVDAVEAFDDVMAGGIYDYLASVGRNDVIVTGLGNLDAYQDKVAITIDPRFEEIGHNLAETLFNIINGRVPKHTKFYYEPLLIRRNTD